MKINELIAATPNGNTQIHQEGLQEQYDESRKHALTSGSPVFNVFHLVSEDLGVDENGDKQIRLQVVSSFFDTKQGLPQDAEVARALLRKFHDVPALDGTVEEIQPE